jgi:hypothetical protein
MSTLSQSPSQPPQPPEPSTADQTRELLQFLRQENEASRTAIRVDAEANRKLLIDTVKFVSIPVGILIVIAGWMGFKSINDLKTTLEAEARQSTQAEITRMQSEIRARLSEQFQTPNLQKTIKDAAVEATKTAAEPLIKSEVAAQVKLRVDEEKPAIAATVTQQTQIAVKQMGSQIEPLVKNSVDAKISTSVDPIVQRIKAEADLQLLITRMNADDAIAFDNLIGMSSFADATQQATAFAAVRSVIAAHNSGMFQTRTFTSPQTDDQLLTRLSDADAASREAALDTLISKRNLTLLPRVVGLMGSDPSIDVRCSAYRLFNNWTVQSFQCLNIGPLMNWWQSNKKNFTPAQ